MQHVIRSSSSLLLARSLPQIQHVRFSSSYVPLGGEKEDLPTKRTLRPRSHGNPSLPLSALFDPVTVTARTKHEEPKPPPPQDPSELTDFQRELAKNVYAQALATPIRTCVLTKARLPAHFLIPFISALPPKSTSAPSSSPSPDSATTQPSLVPRIGSWASHSTCPSSYVLSHHSVLSHLSGPRMRKKQKGGSKWVLLVNERLRRPWAMRLGKGADGVNAGKEWVWDEEMGVRVRRLLGREVVRRVRWCLERQAEEDQESMVLIRREGQVKEGDGVMVRIAGEGRMVEGGGYDARHMVDEETLLELRGLFPEAEELMLKKHPKTVFTHLTLEALKNYMDGSEGVGA